MSNALGQDVHIAHRPTLNRLDSEQTAIGLAEGKTQDGNVPGDNDPGVCATPEAAVGMTYPPTLQSYIALAEPSLESSGLRRLRMASSFLILFLAGWKSVGFPLYVWWMYHAGVGQSSPWSSLLSHTFARHHLTLIVYFRTVGEPLVPCFLTLSVLIAMAMRKCPRCSYAPSLDTL